MRFLIGPNFHTGATLASSSATASLVRAMMGIDRSVEKSYAHLILPKAKQCEGVNDVGAERLEILWEGEEPRWVGHDLWPLPLDEGIARVVSEVVRGTSRVAAPDVYVTDRFLNVMWKRQRMTTRAWGLNVPVGLPIVAIVTEWRNPILGYNEMGWARSAMLATLLTADVTLVHAEVDVDELLALARRELSPARFMDVRKRLTHCPPALDTEWALRRRRSDDRSTERQIVIVHGGSFLPGRRLMPLMRAVERANVGRETVRVLLTSQLPRDHNIGAEELEAFPFVEARYEVGHEDFGRAMAEADIVYLGVMLQAASSLAYFECVLAGLLPLVLRGFDSDRMVPDGYPFVASNEEELARFVRTLSRREVVEAQKAEWMERLTAHVVERVDMERTGRRLYEASLRAIEHYMEGEVGSRLLNWFGYPVFERRAAMLDPDRRYSIDEVVAHVRRGLEEPDKVDLAKLVSPVGVKQVMRRLGWVDDCEGLEPMLVYRGEG